jgi:hypothetical protein
VGDRHLKFHENRDNLIAQTDKIFWATKQAA